MKGKNNEVNRVFHNQKMSIIDHVSELRRDPTYVIDNIYLGNSYNSTNIYTLKKFGIEKVINVTQEIPCRFVNQIEYFVIPIRDTRDNFIEKYLEKSYEFIEKHKQYKILIHCYMGSSRSAIIVVYYLMKKYQMSLDEALEFLKEKRPIVNINNNFINDIEKCL